MEMGNFGRQDLTLISEIHNSSAWKSINHEDEYSNL